MLQGTHGAVAEALVWALLGTLAWMQWRRSTTAGARSGGTALDAAAHAIVEAAEEEAKRSVHIVGSSVNIPDMSANLRAKVAVSEAQQSDPALLGAVYDDMAGKFAQHGLNLPAVQAMRQYFTNLEGPGHAVPLDYAQFPTPLPPWAVRLGVVFFQECNSRLAELVRQASAEVLAALPADVKAHANQPSHYHITVYMSSQPHTIRSDPFDPAASNPQPQDGSAWPEFKCSDRELAAFRGAAAATDAPRFEVRRLLMADSGTLLLCSVDHSGSLAALRRRLRAAFPGGPPKQSTIAHATIARLLTPRQLTRAEIDRVQAVCDAWSARLRGMRFDPDRIYYIQACALGCERTFTTVEGLRVPLPFKQSGGAAAAQ